MLNIRFSELRLLITGSVYPSTDITPCILPSVHENHHFIPCFYKIGFKMFFLNFTYKWYYTIFVFLWFIFFSIMASIPPCCCKWQHFFFNGWILFYIYHIFFIHSPIGGLLREQESSDISSINWFQSLQIYIQK